MSRIVIRNATVYPDDDVDALVRYGCADLDLPSRKTILVRVRHTRVSARRREHEDTKYLYGVSGRAHNYVYVQKDTPRNACWEIHLRVGKPDEFPVEWFDRRGASASIGTLADWQEGLVAIAAHEAMHVDLWQRLGSTRRFGLSRYEVENRCDSYAARRIAAWRANGAGAH